MIQWVIKTTCKLTNPVVNAKKAAMRNRSFVLIAIGVLYSTLLINSCKKDDNPDVPLAADWIPVDQGM